MAQKAAVKQVAKIKSGSYELDLIFLVEQNAKNLHDCPHNTEQCKELLEYLCGSVRLETLHSVDPFHNSPSEAIETAQKISESAQPRIGRSFLNFYCLTLISAFLGDKIFLWESNSFWCVNKRSVNTHSPSTHSSDRKSSVRYWYLN